MQRKIDIKRNVYNAGKGKHNEELIHLHMSNHYRRILNAKKAVDNSPPYCFKLKRASKPTKIKANPPFENLPLTDRSLSTNSNSNKDSWGAESYTGSSRYHVHCIPDTTNFPSKHICQNLDLVDRIANDTKNGPAAYCDEGWMEVKAQHNDKRYEVATLGMQQNPTTGKSSPSAKRRLPNTTSNETAQKRKLTVQKKLKSSSSSSSGVKGTKSFSSLDGKIYSKTLKSEAVSKVRSLRVYYPPRRKQTRIKPENPKINTLEVPPNCKCTKICVCDSGETVLKKQTLNPKEQSVTSSRDSAYNGGVSSLPESRSPTPDQRRKKECCCCCCEKKQGKLFESSKSAEGPVVSPRPPPHPPSAQATTSPRNKNQQQQESFKKMQEDALYVKFIQDITTEILDKNLYTNKALKKVMKRHVTNNIKRLRKDRMLKEVENLRIQLGIPEDKSLLDEEIDGGGVSFEKFYPVISDSEFVMPKSPDVGDDNDDYASAGQLPNSISEVISGRTPDGKIISESDTDNGDVISVIQVMKSVLEKRKEKPGGGTEKSCHISSDDSDRPTDAKKRSVLKNRKQKYVRTYSSSSSDSDRLGKFSRKIREKAESDISESKDTYLGEFAHKSSYLNKKNRSVSFWKNPDLNRVFDVKQKKTVIRSKESVLQDVSRDKRKND